MRLVVQSNRGSSSIVLESADSTGWDAHLRAEGLGCSVQFRAGPEFDLAAFFHALAQPGWKGERWLESRFGELHLASSYDGAGPVPVRARLQETGEASKWSAEATVFLNRDQTADLAQLAEEFACLS